MPQPRSVKTVNAFDFSAITWVDDYTLGTRPSNLWREQIGNISPGSSEWSAKFGRDTLYAYVPNEPGSWYSFINSVLGYAYVENDNTIKRVNPIQHPKFRNLNASRITDARGVQYERRQDTPIGDSNYNGPPQYAAYDRTLCAVEFAPCPYPLYDVEDITDPTTHARQEWLRNVQFDVEPNIYDVTIQVGNFTWAEGSANNPKDKQFPGEVNYLEVKTTFNLIWKLVPEDFVLDYVSHTLMGFPTKIILGGGKVNSASFDGYDAGTLLLLEPKIDRYLSGTLQPSIGRIPIFMCDVILPIIHFDPVVYSSFKGHNTKPWWNKADNTLKYHLVTADGTTTGRQIYGSFDFKKLFEHWSV